MWEKYKEVYWGIVILFVLILLGCVGVTYGLRYSGKKALEGTLAELKAKGEPLTWEELGIPVYREASPDYRKLEEISEEIDQKQEYFAAALEYTQKGIRLRVA